MPTAILSLYTSAGGFIHTGFRSGLTLKGGLGLAAGNVVRVVAIKVLLVEDETWGAVLETKDTKNTSPGATLTRAPLELEQNQGHH